MEITDRTGPASDAGVACPQCGAPVAVRDESPFAQCTHCRATLWVDLGGLVRHAVLRPRLGAGEARGALERFLRAAEVDVAGRSYETRLEFHPWYVIPSAAGGMRLVQASAEAAFADPPRRASEAGDGDAADPALLAGALVIEPSLTADEAVERVDGGRVEGARLVHVPYWRVDFLEGAVPWTARVDAVEGEVSMLALPPASTRKLDGVATGWVVGAIVLFSLEAALVSGVWWTLLAFLVTGAAIVWMVRAGERGAR